jgi:hypothetical protein
LPTWNAMNILETGDLVTEADMDTLRGNLEYLLDPNKQHILLKTGGIYGTTSTSFVDIDAANLSLSLETHGGPVLVNFLGSFYSGGGNQRIFIDMTVDGTRYAGANYGLAQVFNAGLAVTGTRPTSFAILVTGLAAGTHTFTLQWAVPAGHSAFLPANASYCPVHFSAIEL